MRSFKEKSLLISLSFPALTFLVLTLFYLINRFWTADSSMATEGFLKYLCIFLFIVSIWQIGKEKRGKALYCR
ncbi:MAG: hypothetical protein LUG95_03255 [Clostridiales bacterium]|nr:hypothetical protein [Clostridiales bacterium]